MLTAPNNDIAGDEISQKFDILSLNCQSLNQEKANLITEEYLVNFRIKFLCFSETWLNASNIKYIYFDDFKITSNYCRSVSRGGGVGIWCHKNIEAEPLKLPIECSEKDFEVCGVKVYSSKVCGKGKLRSVILNFYRSPKSDFVLFCEKIIYLLDKIYSPNIQLVLTGDFNLDPNRNSRDYSILCDILSSYNLTNIVSSPTRGNSLLDLVFTNNEGACWIRDNTFSDHKTVLIDKIMLDDIKQVQSNHIVRRVFSENAIENFYHYLVNENWSSVYECHSLEDSFNTFHKIFLYYFNLSFPLKYVKSKNTKKKWVNSVIIKSSINLKDLYKLKERYPVLQEYYKNEKKNTHV